jgi:uncharacterized protein YbjT (DUF2867 family)
VAALARWRRGSRLGRRLTQRHMIFVTGATGNVSSEVVRALLAAGEPVRALIREPAQQQALPAAAEAHVGDLNRPDSLAAGLAGTRGVYLLAGYNDMPGFLARARRAGVEQVVLQSSSSVPGGAMGNAVARYHILAETAVRESGLAWTFLQPNSFMSNAFQWLDQLRAGDSVRIQFPDVPVATIDPFDIAAVATAAFTSPAHRGRSYRLSGPESLLPADRVRILGAVLRRPLEPVALSNAETRAELSGAMPTEYVDAFFSFFVDGTVDESTVLPTVQEITGRRPRTFEQWALAHADALR